MDEGEGQPERLLGPSYAKATTRLLWDCYPLCLTSRRLHKSPTSTQINTYAHIRTWDLRGVKASGGGKREWGEGGWGGRENVEDADDLEEVVLLLVDGVGRDELSHNMLVLRCYFI